jgi:hypothetical protein
MTIEYDTVTTSLHVSYPHALAVSHLRLQPLEGSAAMTALAGSGGWQTGSIGRVHGQRMKLGIPAGRVPKLGAEL